jgi:hypothetical protein
LLQSGVASELENLPAAQSVQTQAPAVNYVPAPQSVPSCDPALQLQDFLAPLDDNQYMTFQSAYVYWLRTFPSGNPCRQ